MRVCGACDRPAVFARGLDYLCMKHATEAVGAGAVGYRLLEPETPDDADTLPAPALELERAPTRWRRRRAARAPRLWRRHLWLVWLDRHNPYREPPVEWVES